MVNIKLDIPKGFLEEEIRNDYTVTKQMKEVWAIELDLFAELNRVCNKYNIKFFADGGTILGAIRHGGFIPWDDDIDITMPRVEYEKLCLHADEFKEPYFFQTNYTDMGSVRGHAQLRNSMTTGALVSEKELWFNQGIFIDIFPLDNVPDDIKKFEKQIKKIDSYKKKAIVFGKRLYMPESSNKVKKILKNIISKVGIDKVTKRLGMYYYKKMEKTCQMYNDMDTKSFSILCFMSNRNRYIRQKKHYKEIIMKPFEFIEMPLPVGYEYILKKYYGNYSKIVIGSNLHDKIIFDTEHSYKVYLKEKYNNKFY